ncbi:hypothetical protein FORC38_0898 [Salmonella enterica]|nr:hypothetical protein FORC38_0898 [Salmonella enterica]AZH73328.1 Hypothetical protein FORC80_0971 [Salmonella enterica subsp. enterica serovar Virchow]ESF03315.1 hypothetical protein SEEV1955_12452 [Salmonella enterica subsp. enterica serovar Virchow str. ATCC 51955]
MAATKSDNLNGLSPLARGTPTLDQFPDCGRRFIPAGAGNTGVFMAHSTSLAVYPRWRGEHANNVTRCQAVNGLSPLARGTRRILPDWQACPRFIPAGAGNTITRSLREWLFPVYPRWRGEHFHLSRFRIKQNGLSPLARGTH